MINYPAYLRAFWGRLLIMLIVTHNLLALLPTSAAAQGRPIVITADQPNIWTLEQAHYLLAQMHRRNLDLKASTVGELDANAINGISVDALKTLLSVSAEFDQAVGSNNKLLKDEKTYNASRKRELMTRRATLEDESLDLTRKMAELKIKKLQAKTEDEKKELQAEIDELTIVQETVKEQLGQTNEQLKALPASSGNYQSVQVDAGTTSMANSYDSVFQDTAKKIIEQFNNAPKLNASLRLDNYLQMQYEILSKQLTLLRDEVGPGERLIFMEIPQSINASHDKANDKWAQSWWKIAGYSECVVYTEDRKSVPCSQLVPALDRTEVQHKTSSSQVAHKIRHFNPEVEFTNFKQSMLLTADHVKDKWPVEGAFTLPRSFVRQELFRHFSGETQKAIDESGKRMDDAQTKAVRQDILATLNRFISRDILKNHKFTNDNSYQRNPIVDLQNLVPSDSEIFRRLFLEREFSWIKPLESFGQDVVNLGDQSNTTTLWGNAENRSVRVVDLFPRQSSLNVNDLKLRSSTFSLKFVAQLLSGFGGNANYQREREQYSQFIQQELYSSAFGKGAREFGWTFNPMPGTRRLLSGVRTTYAIVVVPEDTTSIIVESKGCYFPRSSSQPANFNDASWNANVSESRSGCMNPRKFIIAIPDNGSLNNNFEVSEVTYKPETRKGERTVVTIQGRNFSSQIGVLVDGVPLAQSLGIGQPFIRDDSTTGQAAKSDTSSAKVKGTFERIGSNQIVAAFEMDKDYEGVPTITLVAPGKAVDLNSYNGIRVNGDYMYKYGPTPKEWPYIFGKKVGTKENEVMIDKANVFNVSERLNLVITGKNLNRVKVVYVNGEPHNNPNFDATVNPITSPPAPVFGPTPTPTPDPFAEKRYLISLKDLPAFASQKTIQLTLLTIDGTLTPPSIDNPAFKKETPQQEPLSYGFDETKFTISAMPALIRCEETAGKIARATFEVKGLGFTDKTKAFLVIDKEELEQEFVYESSTRAIVRVKEPTFELRIVFKDADSKLKTRKVISWKKPTEGCI